MKLGGLKCPIVEGLTTSGAGRRRRALQVQGAKKDSSPWSTGGPKRGSGKNSGSGSSGSGSNTGGGGGGDSKAGGRKASGSGPSSNPSSGASSSNAGGSPGAGPWKDMPGRRPGLPARGSAGKPPGLRARPAAAPEVTITNPVAVTLLDELSPAEATPEPKWGTFCSHLSGEWVGQYAAYTPWEGKPEPAWLDERGKYINVVYTRAVEYRYKYDNEPPPAAGVGGGPEGPEGGSGEDSGPTDVLIRNIGRCTRATGLPGLKLPPLPDQVEAAAPPPRSGQGAEQAGGAAAAAATAQGRLPGETEAEGDADIDVEALAFNSDGIVVFDGGNYSAGPEYIGEQQVKLVNDDAISSLDPDSDLDLDEKTAGGAGGDAARARSGAGASASGKAAAAGRRSAAGPGLDDVGNDDEDEDEDEEGSTLLPTTTSVLEQCLVDWGSRTRMRLKLTLRIGQLENGEVDVEVLRILLFREEWVGPATSGLMAAPLEDIKTLSSGPCTGLPRPTPAQLQGSWNVFTVCATGVDEVDPFTGEERVVWVYSSTEEQQLWDTSSAPPSGDAGGSYWLPGGVVLSLRMLDNYVPADLDLTESGSGSESEDSAGSASSNGVGVGKGAAAEAAAVSNGNGKGSGVGEGERAYPRGLCVGMSWLWREGSVASMEREYDGYGFLREVRLGQAVKGGWSGGRM